MLQYAESKYLVWVFVLMYIMSDYHLKQKNNDVIAKHNSSRYIAVLSL